MNVFQAIGSAQGAQNNPMSNPQGGAMGGPMGNIGQMVQAFADFKKTMAGKNPEAMVRQLLASGQMSQQTFQQLKGMAQGLQGILK